MSNFISDGIRKIIKKREFKQNERLNFSEPFFIGDLAGVVRVPGKSDYVFAHNFKGVVIEVISEIGLNYNTMVQLGYAPNDPGNLRVLRPWQIYNDPILPFQKEHGPDHSYGGKDPTPIWLEQFMYWKVIPGTGVTVIVYRGNFKASVGWLGAGKKETLDLSSYVPSEGALWVLIEVAIDGTLNLVAGDAVDHRELLKDSDNNPVGIPAGSGRPLAAVTIYAGQTAIQLNQYQVDIIDLRFGDVIGSGNVMGFTPERVILSDPSTGKLYVVPWVKFRASQGQFIVGDSESETSPSPIGGGYGVTAIDLRGHTGGEFIAIAYGEGIGADFPADWDPSLFTGRSIFVRSRGTVDVPEGVQAGDVLGEIAVVGMLDNGDFSSDEERAVGEPGSPGTRNIEHYFAGFIRFVAREDFTEDPTNRPVEFQLWATAPGESPAPGFTEAIKLFTANTDNFQMNAPIWLGEFSGTLPEPDAGFVSFGAKSGLLYYRANGGSETVVGGAGYTPPVTTALNDFQAGDGAGNWIKKTLAEVKTILGLLALAYKNTVGSADIDSDITLGGVTSVDELAFPQPTDLTTPTAGHRALGFRDDGRLWTRDETGTHAKFLFDTEAVLADGSNNPSFLTVKNTSGATAAAGDVGVLVYTAGAGWEYQTTTTAIDTRAESGCVVVVGAANGSDIKVATRGRFTLSYSGSAPAAGDFLAFSATAKKVQQQTTMRPEIVAVAMAAGSGGTVDALLLTRRVLSPITSSVDIFRCNSSSDWNWTGTINGAPSGATVGYTTTGGTNVNSIVPAAANHLGKIILHNTTRGTNALIDNVNTGTSQFTLVSNAPAGWANGDVITTRSQTNTANIAVGVYFYDVDLSSADNTVIPVNAVAILINGVNVDSGNAQLCLHPYEADVLTKRYIWESQVSGRYTVPLPLNEQKFCVALDASGAASAIVAGRLHGYILAIP